MALICPNCGAIAEYNAYYGRITCTSCTWQSEKCKIDTGDRIYRVVGSNNIECHQVIGVHYSINNMTDEIVYNTNLGGEFNNHDIGTMYFLTKESAEKELRRRMNNINSYNLKTITDLEDNKLCN